MNKENNRLLPKLRWTLLGLSITMLAIWLFAFIGMKEVIHKYAMENMEQTSVSIITELNQVFLQLENLSLVMTNNESVQDFITTEDSLQFHTKASAVEKELSEELGEITIAKNIIVYNEQGRFYRFSGNLSNVSVQRLMRLIKNREMPSQIQIAIDNCNYIGYTYSINKDDKTIGRIVMLIDEEEVIRLFRRLRSNEDMKLALAADHEIIISTEKELIGEKSEEFLGNTPYHVREQVGFTPFELMLSYENTGKEINKFFIGSMIAMAVLCLYAIWAFIGFWRKKFFEPIQRIIIEVEDFDGEHNEILPLTGMEHFDGLVNGINDMVERIGQKEEELYTAALSVKNLEIKKQKAMIISLKKQISAHFTINILNIIIALSEAGEKDKVGFLCRGLSDLFRYANEGDSFVKGIEEFFVLNKYIGMMDLRYRNRFETELEMEDYLEDIMLPRMLLQPIVENGIVHGFIKRPMDRVGLLHIYSILEDKLIKIVVEDNGCGIEEDKLKSLQAEIGQAGKKDEIEVEGVSHVALINIQRRINSYFGEGYGIEIESEIEKGTRVILKLPMIKAY